MDATTSNLGNEQIDDNGDLPEENPNPTEENPNGDLPEDNKTENSYIWAHARILDSRDRGHMFFSQPDEIPTCSIVVTHENATVRLKARCIGRFERWNNVMEIPMRTITEEAENVWAEPSAEIIELIEQFKNETVLHEEEIWPIQSEYILKLAAIYSKMHPESTYPHVHTYSNLLNFYFEVHV
ncbi:unnamed protein product [Gongylonema pulchrum]|uniref:RNase H domain-containing protein n=1 Tax=Gongylonema pulchrum TaxID=637853 RepID=A0A183EIW7_9BILA|nr:unnamed protein product [Gongylonema pulchrum]